MVILFDFDGTLADSLSLYLKVYNYYLARHKRRPITEQEFRSLGVTEIAKREKIPKWELFWIVLLGRFYTRKNIGKIKLFPGLKKELTFLAHEHTLGIVTSNAKRNVHRFLKNNNIDPLFLFVESKVSYFGKAQKISEVLRKYNISKKDCVYIGDENRDVIASQKVGIKSVAVTWGFENKNILKKSQADIIVTKRSELYKKLSQFVR